MSPKSRGRPKGRGRAKRNGQRKQARPQLSLIDRVLVTAELLEPDASPLEVELLASEWVAWQVIEDHEAQRAEDTLAAALGASLTGNRSSAAYLALSALRVVATERERERIDELLAAAPDERREGPWTRAERPEPRRAWLVSDPWGNNQVHVVGYDEPEPHQLVVVTSNSSGEAVWGILLEDADGPTPWEEGVGHAAQEVEPADSLAQIWRAILATDLYWPPMWQEDAVELRALARGRADAYRSDPEDWPVIDDEERALLIEEFQARSAVDAPDDVVAMLADTFIDFGDYLVGSVLAWKPGEPERFLTDWVHRKVLLPDDAMHVLPDALKAWIEFCLGRKGLKPADIAVVADEVDAARDEYERLRADESADSPHQKLLRYIADNDIDLDDRDAVDQAIGVVNATALAQLAQNASRKE